MLETGRPVSDVLWYLGDEISHKPDQEYDFPAGFRYDYCNPDVLLNRLSVKNGNVVTPEGLSYRFIWIPENKRMLPETIEKLHQLILQGAKVVAAAPVSIATLIGGEQAQKRFDDAVASVWGDVQPGGCKAIGKGMIYTDTDIEKALQSIGLRPDVIGDVRWFHRKSKNMDWYFVTPLKQSSFEGKVAFAAEGAVEIWDAVTGETRPASAEYRDGYTYVDLKLLYAGSCFVVFNSKKGHVNCSEPEQRAETVIAGPWEVSFPEGWGAPSDVTMTELMPWCEMPFSDEGKAFSGKATYKTVFTLDKDAAGKPVTLDLGKVDMIAHVRLNGKSLRPLWCKPYSHEIGDYVKEGENTLEIDVISTWFNRLVYDASQPEEMRKTWVIAGPSANKSLRPAGLMGPVTLR
jgi:hypothetical protein